VRDYAKGRGYSEDEVLRRGMEDKSVEFVKGGGEIYRQE